MIEETSQVSPPNNTRVLALIIHVALGDNHSKYLPVLRRPFLMASRMMQCLVAAVLQGFLQMDRYKSQITSTTMANTPGMSGL